jgi:halimadienyl-diphosphate synthase
VSGGQAVRELLAEVAEEPSGHTSTSIYETGRLVALAPWLTGHGDRIEYLLAQQRPDGRWGPPDGYALVPTLSATEAMLTVRATLGPDSRVVDAIGRGAHALGRMLAGARAVPVPDTPAADLIVPALVGAIDDRLARSGSGLRLPMPAGMDGRRLDSVRRLLTSGGPVPPKLLHAAEVVPDTVRDAPGIQPGPTGSIGASPAATAAWLGGPPATAAGRSALAYLEDAVKRYGGPVPCATPIAVFERSWVLSTLARAGVPVDPPPGLVRSLADALGADGAAAAPGLPPDADTTAVTVYALALLGNAPDPECLWAYEVGRHFSTWPGEDGVSVTTNAHVLDAFTVGPGSRTGRRRAAAVERVAGWLCERQRPDGAWDDRWHASEYYATSCCALALDAVGRRPGDPLGRLVDRALDRALAWVLATQRPDGSWGRWAGTAEETAYAINVLLGTTRTPDARVLRAAARGCARLRQFEGEPLHPLWHDKDLYRPAAIVRATVLAATHLGRQAGMSTDVLTAPPDYR